MNISEIKKLVLLISSFIISLHCFSQITISGKITDKFDGLGIPGVNIIELGTNNVALSDTDGFFSLQVINSESILKITYIGYEEQEIKVGKTRYFEINLKEYCILDFFDYNDICIGVSSGLVNSPVGGFGYLTFPFPKNSTLRAGIDYQTDFLDNSKIKFEASTLHILAECNYNGDIFINYESIKKNDFSLIEYKIEGKLNFSRPKIFRSYSTLFLGYGLSELSKPSVNNNYNPGPLFGLGTRIGRPLFLNINLKTIYWVDYWEFIGEIKWQYKNFMFSLDYNTIDTYREINLKFGYIFNYHRKY